MKSKSLSNILAFARVAAAGSFARAASDLGLSTSAVSKAVTRLETDLGVKLLYRTTRSLSLTTDGQRFYDGCSRLLLELDALEAEMSAARERPTGVLAVSVPAALGRICLVPLLRKFMECYREVHLELSFEDRAIDLAESGIDVVVRTGPLTDSVNLIVRRLITYPMVVCGTPDYLNRCGRPQHPEELKDRNCINFRSPSTGRPVPWRFTLDGVQVERVFSGTPICDDGEAVGLAAIAGCGLSQMPAFIAGEALRSGKIEEVLRAFRPAERPIWVGYFDRRFVTPRVRAFVDFAIEHACALNNWEEPGDRR